MGHKGSIWIYALTIGCMALFVVVAAWLGYACSPDTPPNCPMDPGFEWKTDFGLLRPPVSSTHWNHEVEQAELTK